MAKNTMHMPRQNRQQQTQQPKFDKEMKGKIVSQSAKRKTSSEMLTSEKARKLDQVANLGVQF